MAWEVFLGGLIAGWLIEFAVDYFFWRPRRICSEAEEELREAMVLLKREVAQLRRQQTDETEEGGEDAEEEQEEEEEAQEDDLERIWGIGPKVEALLFLEGITTFTQLASTGTETLEQLLQSGGERYRLTRYNVLESWQKQAALAAAGQWPELKAMQAELGGRRKARAGMKRK